MSMLTTVVLIEGNYWAVMQNAYRRHPIQRIKTENQEMAELFAIGLAIENGATYVPLGEKFVTVQQGKNAFGHIYAAIVADQNGGSKFVSRITSNYTLAETAAKEFANAHKITYVPKFFSGELCHQ